MDKRKRYYFMFGQIPKNDNHYKIILTGITEFNNYIHLIEDKEDGSTLDELLNGLLRKGIDKDYMKCKIEMINEYKSILRNNKIKILIGI